MMVLLKEYSLRRLGLSSAPLDMKYGQDQDQLSSAPLDMEHDNSITEIFL